MPYNDRKKLIQDIEELRGGRTLISLCNFDRSSIPDGLPGLSTNFAADLKESLYRILKESPTDNGIDLFLYTRGGDTNSVWPIVSLLREFDPDFEILVPFRAHSAGTMLALSSKKVVMTRLAELSPIDPTTGNQFNPTDPANASARLGIAVEDVHAYESFVCDTLDIAYSDHGQHKPPIPDAFLKTLVEKIHPLALGNVHRVHQLVARLAKKLLELHPTEGEDLEAIVQKLTVSSFSHLHMIGRAEAIEILGPNRVEKSSNNLEDAMDRLLKKYEDDFELRCPFSKDRLMTPQEREKEFRFIGGIVESRHWGYKSQTIGTAMQFSALPQGVNVQIPPGQAMPLIPGLPREVRIDVKEQRWHRNTEPEGVTI